VTPNAGLGLEGRLTWAKVFPEAIACGANVLQGVTKAYYERLYEDLSCDLGCEG
jgi:hypothetical protein